MNLDIKPTYDNIIKTLNEDILGRNITLKKFIKTLYLMKDINIISLNGEWGVGKTFFVQQAIEVIKNLNVSNTEVNEEIKDFVNKFKNEELKDINVEKQLYPLYFNAWEYDSNEDPLLTLIYSIIDQNPNLKDIDEKSESIKEKIIRIISSFKIGFSYQDNVGRNFGVDLQYNGKTQEKLTKDIYSVEQVKQTFNELLEEIMIENTNKIVIFIDELDRCNPIFAVKLLERIKHFFDDERFIFVFSINLNELQYTIKKFYGEGMDGYVYLDKFFDLQFSLRNINMENYINSKKVVYVGSLYYMDICVKEMCLVYNFSLRRCNRYLNMISLVYSEIGNRNTDALPTCILFPIILATKIDNINVYNKIIAGEGEKELENIIFKSKEIVIILNDFFNVENKENELNFNFHELYNSIFINKKEIGFQEVRIGNKNVEYAICRKILMDLLTFLNDFVVIEK